MNHDRPHDEPLDPAAGLAIIAAQPGLVRDTAEVDGPCLFVVWGTSWLVGYAPMWLSARTPMRSSASSPGARCRSRGSRCAAPRSRRRSSRSRVRSSPRQPPSTRSRRWFSFASGVAEDRALPFDPFLRTLPAGAGPRLAGRVVNGVLWSFLALVPLVFAGGLFMPPEIFPDWMNAFSQALPTRAARDLVIQVVTGEPAYALALPIFLGWTLLFGVLAVWAYRRDEGRRFH